MKIFILRMRKNAKKANIYIAKQYICEMAIVVISNRLLFCSCFCKISI